MYALGNRATQQALGASSDAALVVLKYYQISTDALKKRLQGSYPHCSVTP